MADINALLAQIMGMTGGMGAGQGMMGANMGGMGGTQPLSNFMAKPTYALSGPSQSAGAGASAGGKAGMGAMDKLGAGANLLKQSGVLPKPVSSGLSGAASGAELGSLGGPIGTGIGAGVGGLAGLLGGKSGGGNPKAQNISVGQIPLSGF